MFSGLFLLIAGVVMLIATVLGYRRGRIMTMRKSTDGSAAQWAARGEAEFLPYALVWFFGGAFLIWQGVRLLFMA
ncbi:MAG: hypothetical protein ACI9DC_001715 [Gammaproteobacteria bacterium]